LNLDPENHVENAHHGSASLTRSSRSYSSHNAKDSSRPDRRFNLSRPPFSSSDEQPVSAGQNGDAMEGIELQSNTMIEAEWA
jgi:hypothetical protein